LNKNANGKYNEMYNFVASWIRQQTVGTHTYSHYQAWTILMVIFQVNLT